jgi:hypothetical protein
MALSVNQQVFCSFLEAGAEELRGFVEESDYVGFC